MCVSRRGRYFLLHPIGLNEEFAQNFLSWRYRLSESIAKWWQPGTPLEMQPLENDLEFP
jgi:hypothetical protein